jgi:hypothetical protein
LLQAEIGNRALVLLKELGGLAAQSTSSSTTAAVLMIDQLLKLIADYRKATGYFFIYYL